MSILSKRYKLFQNLHALHRGEFAFETLCMDIFKYQKEFNPIYAKYLDLIQKKDEIPASIYDIPGLPIELFKTTEIKTGDWREELIFVSSGTGSGSQSRHYVRNLKNYVRNAVSCFKEFYGEPDNYCFLGLLPGYLDRSGSSLISMIQHFMELSGFEENGFFLDQYDELLETIFICRRKRIPVIIFGVSFAFLDFAEKLNSDLSDVYFIETGGMKTSVREITKLEIYQILKESFNLKQIHSEYGMTECFSQAYASADGRYQSSNSMHVYCTQIADPFALERHMKTGQIQIIDLANIDTCSFIGTNDLGRIWLNNEFEVLGRTDSSDLRGCNLLLDEFKSE